MSLSNLEQERQANILANAELLKELELNAGGKARAALPAAPKPNKKKRASDGDSSAPRKRAAKNKEADLENIPTRRSSRLTTALTSAVDPAEQEELRQKQKELEAEEARKLEEIRRARHNDRVLQAIYRTGANWRTDEEESKANENLQSLLKAAGLYVMPSAKGEDVVKTEDDTETKTPTRRSGKPLNVRNSASKSGSKRPTKADEGAIADLTNVMSNLVMARTERVVPERVYSMAVHPTTDKELVFVGDKGGHLGFCDVAAPVVDEVEDDDEGISQRTSSSFAVKAHGRSSISCIRMAPQNAHTLITSAYDCTMRSINFETLQSVELMDAEAASQNEFGDNECLLGGFDMTIDGNYIWACDNRGGILHRDLRQPLKTTKRWQACEKKIGCISLNPVNQNVLVTAHLNRDMRLWDVRKLSSVKTDVSWQDTFREASITEYTHGYACSSAYFDPSGTKILSTSYDDKLRVWNVQPSSLETMGEEFEPDHIAAHDNQTGRYCSVFKAQWCRNEQQPAYFTIGNMRKGLDVFAADGTHIALLTDSELTTVPAVTGSHPNMVDRVYGATASGKIYAWRPAEA